MDYERVSAEVDLNILANNIQQIKSITRKDSNILAVVKADAYGHGILPAAKVFLQNGATGLGVATFEEGLLLREEGITAPILIIGNIFSNGIRPAIKNNLSLTIFEKELAVEISKAAAELNTKAKVHIELDTGMSRLGFTASEENLDEIKKISRLPGLILEGIYTHFASSESNEAFTRKQYQIFVEFVSKLEAMGVCFPVKHASNSGGVMNWPDFSLTMVRPGIILYGVKPGEDLLYDALDIRPALSLKSHVAQVKQIHKRDTIGYGRTYLAKEDMTIAIIPVGYGDGYPRLLSNKGRVLIRGQYANIVGRICMDQFMVDTSHIKDVQRGDEAVLIGQQGGHQITADELADLSDTIGYEILSGLGKRIPRKYI